MKLNLQLFDGICNGDQVLIRGRIFRGRSQQEPVIHNNKWANLLNMLKRYLQVGISGKRIDIFFQGNKYEVYSEKKGLFQLYVPFEREGETSVEAFQPDFRLTFSGNIWMGPVNGMGIISDIDDTILISHANRFRKGFKHNFLKSIGERNAVNNISRFYKALINSSPGEVSLFYVSSSVWNIYDYLISWLKYKDLPYGPLLLRPSRKRELLFFIKSHKRHWLKYRNIKWLLDFFPGLNFVMVGDSGQQDAFLYAEIAKKYPGRIKVVYIRKLKAKDDYRLNHFSPVFEKFGVPFVPVNDMEEAASHASGMGLLNWDHFSG